MSKPLYVYTDNKFLPNTIDSHIHQSLAHADPSLELRTRNRELTEIANSISSLAELFKDLSVLVIDQGTLLDSVEYNIEQTAVHMQEAVKELEVATRFVADCPYGIIDTDSLKVSKEYGKEEMHLPSLARHIWPHCRSHLQA